MRSKHPQCTMASVLPWLFHPSHLGVAMLHIQTMKMSKQSHVIVFSMSAATPPTIVERKVPTRVWNKGMPHAWVRAINATEENTQTTILDSPPKQHCRAFWDRRFLSSRQPRPSTSMAISTSRIRTAIHPSARLAVHFHLRYFCAARYCWREILAKVESLTWYQLKFEQWAKAGIQALSRLIRRCCSTYRHRRLSRKPICLLYFSERFTMVSALALTSLMRSAAIKDALLDGMMAILRGKGLAFLACAERELG